MPISQALVTRYFQLIVKRQFMESERELERLKQNKKMHKTEWNRGYFKALNGMYLSRKKSSDQHSLFAKLDLCDKAAVHGYRREFLAHTKNGLHGDYDRGYFSAWADCMRVIARMEIPSPRSSNKSKEKEDDKTEKIETLKSDKSQATIANFIRKKRKK